MKRSKVWVSGEFHTMLKKKAIEEDTSIINLTDRLAREQTLFDISPPRDKKKRLIL